MNYKFVLVDSTTGQDTQQWVLPLPVTVGRCPSSGIQLDDASISRRHCQFMLDPYGALSLRDSGSTNGVFVDNTRVKKVSVRPGSEVRIGLVRLRVELTDEAETTAQTQQEPARYGRDPAGSDRPASRRCLRNRLSPYRIRLNAHTQVR